jgi:hypothetical protein
LVIYIFLSQKHKNWAPVAYTVILATQEAEIRRITVQSQPGQIIPVIREQS